MTSNSKNFEMLYKIEKQMTGMTKVLVEYTCLKSKRKKFRKFPPLYADICKNVQNFPWEILVSESF